MATVTSDDGAAVDECWNLPTDAFVEILLRIPQGNRWRLRLVCRRWRDVIRERITPATERPVALAFVVNSDEQRRVWASAYVVDDLAEGRCRELWRSELMPTTTSYTTTCTWRRRPEHVETVEAARPAMVGTCNGLLCLCDDAKPGGAISVVNPASRETLAVPPPPGSAQWVPTEIRGWHEAYSFAYSPMTERYTIVHVPCYLDRTGGFNVLQLFALGDAAWRDVPVPGGSCRVDAGLVSVGAVTHWVTRDTERVVAFDLEKRRVASTRALPPVRGHHSGCRLAEVHGRLGVVSPGAVDGRWVPEKVEVWVLAARGGAGTGRDRQQEWSRRYVVQVAGVQQRLAWPHFANAGYALAMDSKNLVFTHRMRVAGALQCGNSVRIGEEGQALSGINGGSIRGVFAYVNTQEGQDPFSAYRSQANS